jgi:hypothetical protein
MNIEESKRFESFIDRVRKLCFDNSFLKIKEIERQIVSSKRNSKINDILEEQNKNKEK